MKSEDSKSNDLINSKNKSGENDNDIRSRLRKNPNKTKFLYTGDYLDQKSKKKKESNSPPTEKEICRTILEIIKKDEKSVLFRQPAIRSFITQKDKEYYKRQIKEPRDLGYITKKLKLNDYSAKDFHDDLELCWSNALSFNENNTEAYQYAVYLKGMAHKLYKEKGLLEIIKKEKEKQKDKDKEKEKDTNSNENTSSNTNTNDGFNIPNKTPSKSHKKGRSKENKIKKENDKNEKTENLSNSSFTNSKKSKRKNNNTDTLFSTELRNNKIIGRKRKRQKNKDNESIDKNREKEKEEEKSLEKSEEKREDRSEDKSEDKNSSEEKSKKSKKSKKSNKKGRKKKDKSIKNDIEQESKKSTLKKLVFDDIKNKSPITHQIISSPEDLEKKPEIQNNKISENQTDNQISSNHPSKSKYIIRRHRKRIKKTYKEKKIPFMTKEETKKIIFEFMWEFFNNRDKYLNYAYPSVPPLQVNTLVPQKNENNVFIYNPDKSIDENKNVTLPNNNCGKINGSISIIKKKKLTQPELDIKNNKNKVSQNINNINIENSSKETKNMSKNKNNIISNNQLKILDKKEDINLQLRINLAKYFDKLSNNNMIETIVYIENIRPQSLRLLPNDTIYIDMEVFDDETFNKVFNFVRNYFQ